jgi:hypothetical protein
MAESKTTKRGATKGQPRPQAVLNDIDLSAAMGEDEMPVAPARRSKWTDLLDKLYTATEEGKVPRGEDGSLKFVKLGEFTNVNGARTQSRALEQRDEGALADVYEFKSVSVTGGSQLWGRVIEVDAEETK